MSDLPADLPDFPEADPDFPEAPAKATGTRKVAKKAPAKKAPARKAAAPADKEPKPGRPSKDTVFRKQLTQQFEMLSMPAAALGALFGGPAVGAADAAVIIDNAEALGDALGAVAESNPKVKAFLSRGVESSSWLGVAFALFPVAQGIYMNHAMAAEAAPDGGQSNPFPSV